MGFQEDLAVDDGHDARVVDAPAKLGPKQKAAVIVQLLLSHDVSPGLDRLSSVQQADLARAMATLGPVSRATLAQVVQEFTTRLDQLALTGPKTLSAALALLEPHISPITRDGLKAEAEADIRDASDPWSRLAMMDADRLRPLLLTESAEVAAILLSKLSVAKAASLLADLPEDRAHIIAHAVSLTATVTPDMVTRIGTQLFAQLASVAEPAFRNTPVDRVGAILNAVNSTQRDALLSGLEARDRGFANDVRRAIFTFAHIPKRVEPTDVPRILRRVDPAQVTMAIAAGLNTTPVTVEFLLENMSKRVAEQLRDDADTLGKPRDAEGEAAMTSIVAAIRALEEEGELRLIPPED
jgi:flagellar motor switch protein FliG